MLVEHPKGRRRTLVDAEYSVSSMYKKRKTLSSRSVQVVTDYVEETNDANISSTPPSSELLSPHGAQWVCEQVREPIGGNNDSSLWYFTTDDGRELWSDGDEEERSPLKFFLDLFPPTNLDKIVYIKNKSLSKYDQQLLSHQELLKFFGILFLCKRCEFGKRKELWMEQSQCDFLPAYQFGRTGISKNRF